MVIYTVLHPSSNAHEFKISLPFTLRLTFSCYVQYLHSEISSEILEEKQ